MHVISDPANFWLASAHALAATRVAEPTRLDRCRSPPCAGRDLQIAPCMYEKEILVNEINKILQLRREIEVFGEIDPCIWI